MTAADAAPAGRAPRKTPARTRRSSAGRVAHDAHADDEVREFLAEVNRRLRPHLERAAVRVAAVAPLREGVVRQIEGGGKRVRAALCVAASELFGTAFVRALHFAATVEHVHNFTLVHDDIADGDPVRRGQPSAWGQYGIGHAINIGDAFVPLAAEAILDAPYDDALKLRLLGLVAQQGLELLEGQNLDLNMRRSDALTYDHYLECTEKKTGALLVMAAVGGGLIGGAGDSDIKRLRTFASLGGVSFQIRDDLLDTQGEKGRTPGSDILQGKRTLLVIHAASRSSATERTRLLRILDKPREATSAADVRWVLDLFRRTEANDYAARVAADLAEQASDSLQSLPESAAKYRLLRLARYLSTRQN